MMVLFAAVHESAPGARMRHSKISDGRPLSGKNGRGADITGTTEFDPSAT